MNEWATEEWATASGQTAGEEKKSADGAATNAVMGRNGRRKDACRELSVKVLGRRAFGEERFLELTRSINWCEGVAAHFITGGNIDQMSYLKGMLLHTTIDRLLLSTWVMAAEDIVLLDEYMESGRIGRLDCYVGEFFPKSYVIEWQMLYSMIYEKYADRGGRLAYFPNHSKVWAAVGDIPFVVETSANCNTNPRNEQGVITISKELAEFYFDYFDEVKSVK